MKRVLSIILALTMVMTLIPAVSANEETDVGGITIVYSFLQSDYDTSVVSAPHYITYSNSGGRMEYDEDNSTATSNTLTHWGAGSPYLNSNQIGEYHTFRIRVPKSGVYTATLSHWVSQNSSAVSDVYLIPCGDESLSTLLEKNPPKFKDVNSNKRGNQSHRQIIETETTLEVSVPGEYYFVIKRTSENYTAMRIRSLTLSQGTHDVPVPIHANITLEKTSIDSGDSKKGEITLSNIYLSNGNATTDTTGITYKSCNETVATISGTTVIAVGEGTAKIQAFGADGYVLDEESITVSRPKAPTVSFYAESNVDDCAIEITATDSDNKSVVPATMAPLTRGADVTVTAPTYEGYTFRGWMRGTKDGQIVSLASVYSFKAMTHTMLTAVYTQDASKDEWYNFNGEFLGTSAPTEDPTLLGYTFLKTWREEVVDGITRHIAQFEKISDAYSITLADGITEVSKDEEANYYDTEITLKAENEVFWLRDGKVVDFGEFYTFNVWGVTDITTVSSGYDKSLPMVYLDSAKGTSRMIEYDNGDYEIVEVGILFGNTGEELTVNSCRVKANSQWKRDHGQFTAKSDYSNARGYLIYEDNGEYKVIYSE